MARDWFRKLEFQTGTTAGVERRRLNVFGLVYIAVGFLILVNSPFVKAQTRPPEIDFRAVSSRDKVERDEPVIIYLSIVNKTNFPISVSGIDIPNQAFESSNIPNLPILLSPHGSSKPTVTIKPRETTKFGLHRLMLSVDFNWSDARRTFTSTQPTTVTVEVTRRFEEEAKGFPGGTAAFLYLLLPIIPAFLSYQTIERLRTGKGLRMPTFRNEYIVPAFFAAIIVSFLMLMTARTDTAVDYSNPRTFLSVLTGSLVLGAVIPGIHAGLNLIQKLRWGFSPKDSMATYVEKALFGPRRPHQFKWVKGTVKGESWEGILLEQPNTAKVLGACLQVSPRANPDPETYQTTVREIELTVLDRSGKVKDPQRLVDLAKAGDLTLNYMNRIKQSDRALDAIVVVQEISNLEIENTEIKPLVVLVE